MRVEENDQKMSVLEQALVNDYKQNKEPNVIRVLLEADVYGKVSLSEEFVLEVLELNDESLSEFIVSCSEFTTPKVIEAMFLTKNQKLIKQYLISSQGRGMNAYTIIALIENGDPELVDYYFSFNAPIVLEDSYYEPLVEYLKAKGDYIRYRNKYLPPRFLRP